jgi:2-polyprenyl-3-methyl-5-hydroxy-6-metoxy-1,4-benzoquinol methylase
VTSARWNHNIHYHPLILDALPVNCGHVLDVGCGDGILAQQLSDLVGHVTGIDKDASVIKLARQATDASNVSFVIGDFLAFEFEDGPFDAIVSNTALHHMDVAEALERMKELVRPGGTVAIVGWARSHYPGDLIFDLAGAFGTRIHKLTKTYWEHSAPVVLIADTFGETRNIALEVLPGVRYRRHILWRYSLIWRKPN